MAVNIPRKVQHGSTLKAKIFDGYALNNTSRHVYSEQGATGRDNRSTIMTKGYEKKTVVLTTILGKTATSVNWSIEGRNARDKEWGEIYSYSETTGGYPAKVVNITEEWDWISIGAYIDGGTNAENPLITATLLCHRRS